MFRRPCSGPAVVALATLTMISACGMTAAASRTAGNAGTPACSARQLRLSYRAGGAGAGSDFGVILVRDVAAEPCRLDGQLQVTGVNTAGVTITNTVAATIARPGVLAAHMPPLRDLAPVPAGILAWMLQAAYRDDPTFPNGLCAAHYVVAARWRVRLPDGSDVMTANADSGSQLRLSASGGLVTCRGRLGGQSEATLDG